jgi:endonuclease/exonuclease/phosphatase family metal-dependent hydrolase
MAPREPDAKRERLCARRPLSSDGVQIDCRLETATFGPPEPGAGDEIVLMAYNVERGFRWRKQLHMLLSDPEIPAPDIILMSEADRGCRRTGYQNVAREYARALGMHYAYGVEFVELPRYIGPGGAMFRRCEHGNAILSRYPLKSPRLIRHRSTVSWYSWWQRTFRVGEPRMGGRMALAADVKVGGHDLRLYSVHFESRGGNEPFRGAQAAELADDGATALGGVVIGGDMNCGSYLEDLREGTKKDSATLALFARGYKDSHAALAADDRITTRSGVVIDVVFGRKVEFLNAGIGDKERWNDLSDHLPVWTRLRLG